MNDVQQKVAIVTGASQGIGAGLVAAFRQHGYAVVANSRSIADSRDPKLLAIAGDIIDPGTANRIVTAAVERFGRVGTLFNNAGVFVAKPFTPHTTPAYTLATNTTGSL